MDKNDVIATLNDLIETSRDGEDKAKSTTSARSRRCKTMCGFTSDFDRSTAGFSPR